MFQPIFHKKKMRKIEEIHSYATRRCSRVKRMNLWFCGLFYTFWDFRDFLRLCDTHRLMRLLRFFPNFKRLPQSFETSQTFSDSYWFCGEETGIQKQTSYFFETIYVEWNMNVRSNQRLNWTRIHKLKSCLPRVKLSAYRRWIIVRF